GPPPGSTPAPPPPTGGWVAQLASVPKADGAAARERQAAALRKRGIFAPYVDSDDWASLRGGYWMFHQPGFPDGAAAVNWCRSYGLTSRNDCVGRFLSDDPGDRNAICLPAGGGGTTGRCGRS
ncbi:serine/threonine protein kinase, partial [Streptomyces sp. NPDC060194]